MNKKTVLVTGSSRGIGKAIAIKFAKKNYNVVINCLKSEDRLLAVKKEIEGYNVSCLTYLGDVGDYENAKELFSLIKKQFGGIDILVNNAGISYIGLFQDMEPDVWGKMMNTNITSIYNCCHFAIPEMVTRKQGKIINISSVWGITGASCEVAYSATKGAVNALTKALAKELAPSGIQVNAVACGAIDTEMNYFLDDQELIDLINDIPAGRLGQAEEVADFVYQIATKHSYLTGQAIVFDGGWI
ncbi:elongation factor P 5-aminopentanone reductase [[Clostridium] fimetarium]|uniref:3-oxoacyl-[acyl-carrier protein] reductase n=1 Tax=[Clostridium] fimetarium TaxID=99656 RepID=A0A1I0R7W3_9FIRM|nr:SDR family NAD(P)-dependent oxidoreductase [[Clostridium] fimetarium]SEW36688.1 3-oxoacyl-[acyl-carrier protein] reductase [[Clostridium] fimetarium]